MTSRSSMYQPPTARTCSISSSASTLRGSFRKPRSWSATRSALGVVVEDRLERRDLQLDLVLVELLRHPEVEERHPPVRQQQVVAGMGVGVEVLEVVDRAEAEAEHDLAEAVALLLRQLAHLVEAGAVHPLAHQHALGGQARDHVRHVDERVAPVAARERALRLRLELVVELLHHPLLQLLGRGLRVEPGRERLGQAQDQPGVLHVGGDRRRHAGVLHLHRHPPAVRQHRAVHLADRGRRRSRRARSPRRAPPRARPTPRRAPPRTFSHGIGGAVERSVASLSW